MLNYDFGGYFSKLFFIMTPFYLDFMASCERFDPKNLRHSKGVPTELSDVYIADDAVSRLGVIMMNRCDDDVMHRYVR